MKKAISMFWRKKKEVKLEVLVLPTKVLAIGDKVTVKFLDGDREGVVISEPFHQYPLPGLCSYRGCYISVRQVDGKIINPLIDMVHKIYG